MFYSLVDNFHFLTNFLSDLIRLSLFSLCNVANPGIWARGEGGDCSALFAGPCIMGSLLIPRFFVGGFLNHMSNLWGLVKNEKL